MAASIEDRQRNLRAGRLMAVLLGSSFHVLRFGHLTHHQYNRNPIDRPDIYDPAVTPRLKARIAASSERWYLDSIWRRWPRRSDAACRARRSAASSTGSIAAMIRR